MILGLIFLNDLHVSLLTIVLFLSWILLSRGCFGRDHSSKAWSRWGSRRPYFHFSYIEKVKSILLQILITACLLALTISRTFPTNVLSPLMREQLLLRFVLLLCCHSPCKSIKANLKRTEVVSHPDLNGMARKVGDIVTLQETMRTTERDIDPGLNYCILAAHFQGVSTFSHVGLLVKHYQFLLHLHRLPLFASSPSPLDLMVFIFSAHHLSYI